MLSSKSCSSAHGGTPAKPCKAPCGQLSLYHLCSLPLLQRAHPVVAQVNGDPSPLCLQQGAAYNFPLPLWRWFLVGDLGVFWVGFLPC